MAQGSRPDRVAEEVRHVLSDALARDEVHDDRLGVGVDDPPVAAAPHPGHLPCLEQLDAVHALQERVVRVDPFHARTSLLGGRTPAARRACGRASRMPEARRLRTLGCRLAATASRFRGSTLGVRPRLLDPAIAGSLSMQWEPYQTPVTS